MFRRYAILLRNINSTLCFLYFLLVVVGFFIRPTKVLLYTEVILVSLVIIYYIGVIMSTLKSECYRELSVNAQRMFVTIERILWFTGKDSYKITKEDLAINMSVSIPTVKVALRELKKKGFVVADPEEETILSIGPTHKYKHGYAREEN